MNFMSKVAKNFVQLRLRVRVFVSLPSDEVDGFVSVQFFGHDFFDFVVDLGHFGFFGVLLLIEGAHHILRTRQIRQRLPRVRRSTKNDLYFEWVGHEAYDG